MHDPENFFEVDENGVGKCSVPVYIYGIPAGLCELPAYGNQTPEGKLRYGGYMSGLACYYHGGPKENLYAR